MPEIIVHSEKLDKAILDFGSALGRTTVPNGRAARTLRDYVRQTITMQGRKRPYAPLSKWTKARTNRRKALITLRPRIKASWDDSKGVVYFDAPSSDWHIDMHHRGYRIPAISGKLMVVPAAKFFGNRPAGGTFAAFKSRKASKVPAREIWPNKAEVKKVIEPIYKDWVQNQAEKNWR